MGRREARRQPDVIFASSRRQSSSISLLLVGLLAVALVAVAALALASLA